MHLVSVWASEARLVLAQQKVEAKSNEMTAVPLLLEMLDLQGSVVTTDALNTQKNIAAAIQEGGGDYVLALKENHRHLFEDVRDFFAWCQKQRQKEGQANSENPETVWDATWEKSEWGHGRHEVRRGFVLSTAPDEWSQALRAWKGLQCVVMVERERTIVPPEGLPVGAVLSPTRSRHFFLSSLGATDGRVEKAIRAHWGIENSCHRAPIEDAAASPRAARTATKEATPISGAVSTLAASDFVIAESAIREGDNPASVEDARAFHIFTRPTVHCAVVCPLRAFRADEAAVADAQLGKAHCAGADVENAMGVLAAHSNSTCGAGDSEIAPDGEFAA